MQTPEQVVAEATVRLRNQDEKVRASLGLADPAKFAAAERAAAQAVREAIQRLRDGTFGQ